MVNEDYIATPGGTLPERIPSPHNSSFSRVPMLHSALVLLVLTGLVSAQSNTNATVSDVEQAFVDAKVVPDVLPTFAPTALLNVTFTDQATGDPIPVTPGLNLTMEQTALQPTFTVITNNGSLIGQTFVLAIVDPDAPTPQNTSISQFRHMLAGDLHVNGSDGTLANSSAALSDFVNPTPPAGSDPHRYVILLYTQPANFDTNALTLVNASTPRNNFNLTTFGQAVGLGNPVAGNFFLTGPSDSSNTTTGGGSAPSPTASTTGAAEIGAPVTGIIWVLCIGVSVTGYVL